MALDFKNTNQASVPLATLCIGAAVLQLLLAPYLSIFGGRINFMLVLVLAASLGADSRLAVYIGFGAGLFYDLTSAAPIGLMPLLLTPLAYLISHMSRGVALELSANSLRLAFASSFMVCLVYSILMVVLGIETSILSSLGHGLMSALLCFVACIPVFAFFGSGTGVFTGKQKNGFSASSKRGGKRFKNI